MVKKPTTTSKQTKVKTGISKELSTFIEDKRKALASKIGAIPDEMLLEFGSARIPGAGPLQHGGHFSDWHDSFSNEGTWWKSWGKAGDALVQRDRVTEVQPAEMVSAISKVQKVMKDG
ncbi:MAG: hypothetical protein NUV50_00545 [Rhodospirillales bacterium]|nr:hypothetical protein [Rhodospirillales bacterium]